MSKKSDFVKSIHGMNENDLKARLEEDKQRLKKLERRANEASAFNPTVPFFSLAVRCLPTLLVQPVSLSLF